MNDFKVQKSEKIDLKPKYEKLMLALDKKQSLFDERLLKKIGKEVGFQSTDQKVYKLLSVVSENMFDELFNSINHKNCREIEEISKKIIDAKTDQSKLYEK